MIRISYPRERNKKTKKIEIAVHNYYYFFFIADNIYTTKIDKSPALIKMKPKAAFASSTINTKLFSQRTPNQTSVPFIIFTPPITPTKSPTNQITNQPN